MKALSWSPSGTHFVFQDANDQLQKVQLVAGAIPTTLGGGKEPCWADLPGAREWIACIDATEDVTLVNPMDGTARVKITTDGTPVGQYKMCSWSNGSDQIFFQSQNGKIYQMPITWTAGVPAAADPSPTVVQNGPGLLQSPLRFWGTPAQAVSAIATGLNIADYVDGGSPTFVQNLGFQIDTPAYTSGWDDINWIR